MANVGCNIRTMRERRGMTQQDLAAAIGKSSNAVSNWERSERDPGCNNLILICKALNCSYDEILAEDPEVMIPGYLKVHDGTLSGPIIGRISIMSIPGELAAVRIKTDHMSPYIMPGDTVIIDRQFRAKDGDAVLIALNDGRTVCNRLSVINGTIMLIPVDIRRNSMLYEGASSDFSVIGRIVEVRRSF